MPNTNDGFMRSKKFKYRISPHYPNSEKSKYTYLIDFKDNIYLYTNGNLYLGLNAIVDRLKRDDPHGVNKFLYDFIDTPYYNMDYHKSHYLIDKDGSMDIDEDRLYWTRDALKQFTKMIIDKIYQ